MKFLPHQDLAHTRERGLLNFHLVECFSACNSCPHLTKVSCLGFPGGAVVESPPANAGDTGSSPGPGGSHVPRSSWACVTHLLSLHSRAREPQLLRPACLEPVLRNGRSHCSERPAHRNEEWPLLTATRESLCAAMKSSPCSQQLEKAPAQQQRDRKSTRLNSSH